MRAYVSEYDFLQRRDLSVGALWNGPCRDGTIVAGREHPPRPDPGQCPGTDRTPRRPFLRGVFRFGLLLKAMGVFLWH